MARFSILALLLLATIETPAHAQSQAQSPNPQDPDRLFARAIELHQAGDMLGAIDNYKAVLAILPERADVLSNLGAAYVRLGQFDDAIKQYEAALTIDPSSSAALLNLGLAYYKSGRPNQAILQLRRVIASEPQARNAYLVLAECYLQTGEDREVIALLKPREEMLGGDLAYAYLLGTALLHTDDVVEGQKYVDRIFGAGDSAEAHLLMAIAHVGQRDYQAAKTEIERALKLNPALPTAHSLHGRALLALGDMESAERAFRRELDLNINDFQANLQMGNMRRRLERFGEASAYLERAVTIRPQDLAARKLLGDLKLQVGKTEDAVQIYEAIVKETPDIVEVHVQLATAYNRLKRPDDAKREREIVDRLNAQAQAKQAGKGPGGQ
jgi:tetratricopeptide (TPR) repeat protein